MRIGRNLIFNIAQSLSQVLFPIITFPYASRVLGPQGIGTVNFADAFCRYFILFSALGIPIYGIREIAKVNDSMERRSLVFSEIFTIHLISTLFFSLIYLIVVLSVNRLNQNLDIYLLGLFFIVINVFSIEWFYNGLSEFRYVAIRSIVTRLVFIIALFLWVKQPSHVFLFFFLNVMVVLLNNIWNVVCLKGKASFSFNRLHLKKHLRPLIYIYASTMAISVYVLIDTLVLGFIKGDTDVGYYSTAVKVVKMPLVFITSLGAVTLPQMSKFVSEGEFDKYKHLIKRSFEFIVVVSVPVFYLLWFCAEPVILLFAGQEFSAAIFLLKMMAILPVLIGISNLYGLQLLTVFGKDSLFMKSVLLGTISSIITNFLFIPKMGKEGAAIASIFAEICVTVATIYFASKVYNFSAKWSLLFWQLLAYSPVVIFNFWLSYYPVSFLIKILINTFIVMVFFIVFNLKVLKVGIVIEGYDNLIKKIRKQK